MKINSNKKTKIKEVFIKKILIEESISEWPIFGKIGCFASDNIFELGKYIGSPPNSNLNSA